MPFVPAPTIVKVSVFQDLNGQPIMNRMHVGVPNTLPTAGDCATLAAIFANWWLTAIAPISSNQLILREVEAVSIAEQNGPQATFTTGLPQAADLINPSLPGNIAFCVSLRTGLTGRSARGRWYQGGLTEGDVVGNVASSTYVADVVAALDGLIGIVIAAAATPMIVSYVSGGIPRPGGPVYFPITDALAVDNIVDSQRGRLH